RDTSLSRYTNDPAGMQNLIDDLRQFGPTGQYTNNAGTMIVFQFPNTNPQTRNIPGAEFLYVSIKDPADFQTRRVDITFNIPEGQSRRAIEAAGGTSFRDVYATPDGRHTNEVGGHSVFGESLQVRSNNIARNVANNAAGFIDYTKTRPRQLGQW